MNSNGIRIILPSVYNIETPVELTKRPGLGSLPTWGWANAKELLAVCHIAHEVSVASFGKPEISISWIDGGFGLGLIQCFWPLMFGNNEETFPVPHYTYVHCYPGHTPTLEDFHLDVTTLPGESPNLADALYVPSGWANEVANLIKLGFHQIRPVVTVGGHQELEALKYDGAYQPYSFGPFKVLRR